MVENCCENLVLGEDTRGWGGMRSLGYSVVVAILQLAGSKYTHSRGFSQDNPTRYSLFRVESHCNKIHFRGPKKIIYANPKQNCLRLVFGNWILAWSLGSMGDL